jgi:hypothetical protein
MSDMTRQEEGPLMGDCHDLPNGGSTPRLCRVWSKVVK